MSNPWFDVSQKGLAALLANRNRQFVLKELLQNAWDQDVTTVKVTLEAVPGQPLARLVIEDDDPEGFRDLTHAYTLFAPSAKLGNPGKRGRFNLGEKYVLAICREATIVTTKGGLRFDKEGRHVLRLKREKGSSIDVVFPCTREQLAEINDAGRLLIPQDGIETTFNGMPLSPRHLVGSMEATLPTVVADAEGNLARSTRNTQVDVYECQGDEPAWLFEMGIPVVETELKWHVDVRQKVPLNMDRDNVSPSYLAKIRVLLLNAFFDHLTKEDANADWVREATSSPDCDPQATRTILDKRFGEKRVAYDPSDPEANKRAVSEGYVVVHGGMLSGQEWENAKASNAVQPAGQITPSPKPYGKFGRPEDIIPESEWSGGMVAMAQYAKWLALELMGVDLAVKMTRAGVGFSACYGGQELTFNIGRLGRRWFKQPFGVLHDKLLIHEFGHEYSGDHLSSAYHSALCELGVKFVCLALEKPEELLAAKGKSKT